MGSAVEALGQEGAPGLVVEDDAGRVRRAGQVARRNR